MLAVTCQKSVSIGGGGKCLYIDTSGTFSTVRLLAIAKGFGMAGEEVLGRIDRARAKTIAHLGRLLDEATEKARTGWYNLIVVDSAVALFRNELTGLAQLPGGFN